MSNTNITNYVFEQLQLIIYTNNINYLENCEYFKNLLSQVLTSHNGKDLDNIIIKLIRMCLNSGNKKIFDYIYNSINKDYDLDSFISQHTNSVFLKDAIYGNNLELINIIYKLLDSDEYTQEILNNAILNILRTNIINNIDLFQYLFNQYKHTYDIDNYRVKQYIAQIITQYETNRNYIDALNVLYWFKQIIENSPNNISSSIITDVNLLDFIQQNIDKFMELNQLYCSNSQDYFSLDEFKNNQDIVYFIMPNGKTYCFDYDNLIQWFSQNEAHMAQWISNDIHVSMDDSGRGGHPNLIFIVHKIPAEYTFYISDDIYYEIIENKKKIFKLDIIHPNLRIGNLDGMFGISMLHGQIPGENIYG
jgi:hypothetical protein